MSREVELFRGTVGKKQLLRVWIEEQAGGIRLLTHEIGPELEQYFGKDELETFLEIDAEDMPALTAALRAEAKGEAAKDAIDLLAEQYASEPVATTKLRVWLDQRRIPHRFTLV